MGWTKIADLKYLRGQSVFLSLPKNEGIDIILPGMSKEMKDDFFLNLLSHLYSTDVATLR